MSFTIVFHHHHHHHPHHHNPHHHHHHPHHRKLSPRTSVLFLLLLLFAHACHSDPVHGDAVRDDAGDDVKQRHGLSELVRRHRGEGVLHGGTGHRHQRQGEDLGSNTPAAKDTTASDSDDSSKLGKGERADSTGHRHKRQSFDFSMNTPRPKPDAGSSTTPCDGINMCAFGYQCDNGGTCLFNTTSCSISCRCPPPYDDPALYDQAWCRALNGSAVTSPTPAASYTTSAVGPASTTACWSLNTCAFGHECHHGGTCHYNTTTCHVYCLCTPPYDDGRLYDQQHCTLLPTTLHPPSSSTPPASVIPGHSTLPSAPNSPPATSTTLRPLRDRRCKVFTCLHGYCDATDVTGRPCKCDPGWQGFFCDFPCSRLCSNGGVCKYFLDTDRQKCLCRKPWTGENCTEREPNASFPDNSLVHWLSGSFAVGLVLVITCGAVFMFYLWRKRLVFALKIVYYFLPYEDNDGRQYDAFVSYVLAGADEAFVYTHLRSKLETEMGFNLCLHQRDFPVGGVISESILDALDNSRRFILILTPSYLKNEWAEFEFQRAFHEMLKRKLRIIPILVEDISQCQEDCLNPTLKTIMDSVALLTFPGTAEQDDPKSRKFWKQLKLCMPKKKKNDDGSDTAEVRAENGTAVVKPADITNINANAVVGHHDLNGGDRIYAEENAVELCWNVCDDGGEHRGKIVDQHGGWEDAVELSNINVGTGSVEAQQTVRL